MSILDEINELENQAAAIDGGEQANATEIFTDLAITSDDFRAAIDAIAKAGKGVPTMRGPEALAYNALKGTTGDVKGEGQLATLDRALTFDEIIYYAQQACGMGPTAQQAQDAQDEGILPTNAPVSDPASEAAADPVQGHATPETADDVIFVDAETLEIANVAEVSTKEWNTAKVDLQQDDAPSADLVKCIQAHEKNNWSPLRKHEIASAFSELILTRGAPANVSTGFKTCADAVNTGKWGPIRKSALASVFGEIYDPIGAHVQDPDDPPQACKKPEVEYCVPPVPVPERILEAQSQRFRLFIDCIPSVPFDHFQPFVRDICESIEKQTGAKDIRCSDHDALSFGKWKGAVAAAVREMEVTGDVYIDTSSEINAVVAETLIESADIWVRGRR